MYDELLNTNLACYRILAILSRIVYLLPFLSLFGFDFFCFHIDFLEGDALKLIKSSQDRKLLEPHVKTNLHLPEGEILVRGYRTVDLKTAV